MSDDDLSTRVIVLFDGTCGLCDAAVQFILNRDPRGAIAFAPLQSDVARRLLTEHPIDEPAPDTIVLIDHGRVFVRSDAALRIASKLRSPWPALTGLYVVPRSFRDALYRWIAANRLRWFGKRAQCRIPTPEQRSRFLA